MWDIRNRPQQLCLSLVFHYGALQGMWNWAGHDHAQAVSAQAESRQYKQLETGYLVSAQMAGRARSTVTPRLARSRLETHAVRV